VAVCSSCAIGGLALSAAILLVCRSREIRFGYLSHIEKWNPPIRRGVTHVLEMPPLSPIVTNFSFSFSLRMSSLATTPISFLSSSTTGTSTITL
jgi:hypothetical protein